MFPMLLNVLETIYYLVINIVYNLISLLLDSKSKLVVKSEKIQWSTYIIYQAQEITKI